MTNCPSEYISISSHSKSCLSSLSLYQALYVSIFFLSFLRPSILSFHPSLSFFFLSFLLPFFLSFFFLLKLSFILFFLCPSFYMSFFFRLYLTFFPFFLSYRIYELLHTLINPQGGLKTGTYSLPPLMYINVALMYINVGKIYTND